jgi:hypothetical protein
VGDLGRTWRTVTGIRTVPAPSAFRSSRPGGANRTAISGRPVPPFPFPFSFGSSGPSGGRAEVNVHTHDTSVDSSDTPDRCDETSSR